VGHSLCVLIYLSFLLFGYNHFVANDEKEGENLEGNKTMNGENSQQGRLSSKISCPK
jgi:hypothetical protein